MKERGWQVDGTCCHPPQTPYVGLRMDPISTQVSVKKMQSNERILCAFFLVQRASDTNASHRTDSYRTRFSKTFRSSCAPKGTFFRNVFENTSYLRGSQVIPSFGSGREGQGTHLRKVGVLASHLERAIWKSTVLRAQCKTVPGTIIFQIVVVGVIASFGQAKTLPERRHGHLGL